MIYIVYNAFDRDIVNSFYFKTKPEAKDFASTLGNGWFWIEMPLKENL